MRQMPYSATIAALDSKGGPMNNQHMTPELIAYLDQELSLSDMDRVRAHLEECELCRVALERLRAMQHDLQTTLHLAMDCVRLPHAAEKRIRDQL
jgi:anti-sigma factor RsiW